MRDICGVSFFIIFITLFRLAEFIFIPQLSPVTPPLIDCLTSFFWYCLQIFEKIDFWISTYIVYPAVQFVFSWLPYVLSTSLIWFGNMIFCAFMQIIWWTMYLSLVWKYLSLGGRSFAQMLQDPHQDFILANPPLKRYYVTDCGDRINMWLAHCENQDDI